MSPGQIAVCDGHPACSGPGQPVDARPDRTVQALPRLPHDSGADLRRPLRHALVVAHHGNGHRHACRHDMCRHGPDELYAFGIGEGRSQPSLGLVEGFDRDQDDLGPQLDVDRFRRVLLRRHGGPRHRDSVGVHAKAVASRRRLLCHE